MGWGDIGSSPDHLSHSQIEMFKRCPKQYELRYIKGIKRPPSWKMMVGTSAHAGIELNYKTKFKKRKPANFSKVMDAFGQSFEENKSVTDFEGENKGRIKDLGYQFTRVHYNEVAPKVQPIAEPELQLTLQLAGVSKPITMYLDVVAESGLHKRLLLDNKTTGKKKTQLEADTSQQLTLYKLGWEQNFPDKPLTGLGLDVLVHKDGLAQEPQRLLTRRTREQVEQTIKSVQQVELGIAAGLNYTADNERVCSWCGYRDICPSQPKIRKVR